MGGAVDPVGDHRRHKNSGKPQQGRGIVVRAPISAHDGMVVLMIGFQQYEIPADNWMPRPNPSLDSAGGAGAPLLPRAGAHCLITIDHLNDAWVSVWAY